MKKWFVLFGMAFALGFLIAGCGITLIEKEEIPDKEFFLVIPNGKISAADSIPKGKCGFELRGKHSEENLVKENNKGGDYVIKKFVSKGEGKYTSCIDSFSSGEINEMKNDRNIIFIKYVGEKDPFKTVIN